MCGHPRVLRQHRAERTALDKSRLGSLVDDVMGMLPADQREAFLLKHVEQLGYEEMAAVTGAGVSALKMRVKRACERLRHLLGEVNDVRS